MFLRHNLSRVDLNRGGRTKHGLAATRCPRRPHCNHASLISVARGSTNKRAGFRPTCDQGGGGSTPSTSPVREAGAVPEPSQAPGTTLTGSFVPCRLRLRRRRVAGSRALPLCRVLSNSVLQKASVAIHAAVPWDYRAVMPLVFPALPGLNPQPHAHQSSVNLL